MQKLFLSALLLLTTVPAAMAQGNISFPTDFLIPAAVMPAGFIPEPVNEEALQAGVTENPGLVKGTGFIAELYDGADIDAVEALHVAMYVPRDNPGSELGVYTIAYKSPEDLGNEMKKISMYAGSRYLFTGRYLVQVWGDSGSFEEDVDHLADYLKKKLALQEFFPPASETDSVEATEVSGE